MHRSLLLCASAAASLILVTTVFSYQRGALPGTTGLAGTVPATIVRTPGMGCGQCHTPTLGAPLPTMDFLPAQRSLDLGQSIQVNAAALGGVAGTAGGFTAEAVSGTFTAGTNTKTSIAGDFVTHRLAAFGRSWQFGYTAPATPGQVLLYAATNTANGNAFRTGDSWAFHGGTQSNSAPIRLYANAPGVTHAGDGCVGGFGLWPVLGAPQSPTVGNAGFQLAVHGTVPASLAVFLIGTTPTVLDLTGFGITGCNAYLLPTITFNVPTTPGGSAANGDGAAFLPLPLPNQPALSGLSLLAQALVLDPNTGRPANATMTNAVTVTIQ